MKEEQEEKEVKEEQVKEEEEEEQEDQVRKRRSWRSRAAPCRDSLVSVSEHLSVSPPAAATAKVITARRFLWNSNTTSD